MVGVFDPDNTAQYVLYRITPAIEFASIEVIVLLVGYRLGTARNLKAR